MFILESFHKGIEPFLLVQFAHKTALFGYFDQILTRLYLIGSTGTPSISFIVFSLRIGVNLIGSEGVDLELRRS